MVLQAESPLFQRLAAYLVERFPPVAYTLLTVLFFGSAMWVAQAFGGGAIREGGWWGAVIVWLVFLHLRIFDEHKDAEQDRTAHPERLLSRGVVTLPLLRIVALLAIVIQLGLSVYLGIEVLVVWGATWVFTLLMAVEFGVGKWLKRHMVLYAITHNPVVAGLGLLGWACTTARWTMDFGWYLGAVSLGSLAFEFGRKIHQPAEEVEGVDSYSSVLGRRGASWLLRIALLAAGALGLVCCWDMGQIVLGNGPQIGGGIVIAGTVAGLAYAGADEPSKKVEMGATVALLSLMTGLWVAAW